MKDVKENSSWSCRQCGDGGTCVKGDESMCLAVHMIWCKAQTKKEK